MAITYIGRSAVAATTTTTNVSVPTGYAEDDLLVMLIECEHNPPSVPSGWTLIRSTDTSTQSLTVCYKYATSSESAVSITAESTPSVRGVMLCFRGVVATSPVNVTGENGDTGITFSATGVTTTVANCMVVVAVGFRDSGGKPDTTNYSSWANANLVSITEGLDALDNVGDYCGGIAFVYGIKATAGATGNTTATTDSSGNASNIITFALAPAAVPDVSVSAPLMTIADAQIQTPTVSVTISVTRSVPLSTISVEMAEPVITVTANISISTPLIESSAQLETPSASATEGETSVTASVPVSTVYIQIEIPKVTAENGAVSVTVEITAMAATVGMTVPHIFNEIINPLMTIDALGNIKIRGSVKMGSSISLDMFGNLTAVEFIAGDKLSISADGKLTAKSITEYMG